MRTLAVATTFHALSFTLLHLRSAEAVDDPHISALPAPEAVDDAHLRDEVDDVEALSTTTGR